MSSTSPSTPPALRTQLEAVTSIRDFASHDLGLPDNGSYRSYADVGRPYVVWNVVAAPEFSVDAKHWCYPIVGCVAYRGYFVESQGAPLCRPLARARLRCRRRRRRRLFHAGHFNDPVLNTMVGWNDVELASIIFHELTHQLLYVPNDASFNEALATTVEEEGVRRWLRRSRPRTGFGGTSRAAGALPAGDRAIDRDPRELRTLYASARRRS